MSSGLGIDLVPHAAGEYDELVGIDVHLEQPSAKVIALLAGVLRGGKRTKAILQSDPPLWPAFFLAHREVKQYKVVGGKTGGPLLRFQGLLDLVSLWVALTSSHKDGNQPHGVATGPNRLPSLVGA